jgi:hypothetical protein
VSGYRLDERTIEAKGPAKPPVQWVLGVLPVGITRPGRDADHAPPSSTEEKDE